MRQMLFGLECIFMDFKYGYVLEHEQGIVKHAWNLLVCFIQVSFIKA